MPDRTTLNIDKTVHQNTRQVKNEFGESWTDVLRFYERHRAEVALADADATGELAYDDVVAATRDALRAELPDRVLQE